MDLIFFLYVRGGPVFGKSTRAGDTMLSGFPDLLAVKVPRGDRYVRGGGERIWVNRVGDGVGHIYSDACIYILNKI